MSFFKKTKKSLKKFKIKIPHFKFKKIPKWKIIAFYLFYAFIVAIFVVGIAFAWFAKDLPTPSKIANRKPVESTKIYDRTGKTLLYETGEQKRTVVASDQIPQNIKDATVSVEDASFYQHHGFDLKEIASALYHRASGKTAVTRGASTITQQYVKNALLTSDRSLTRKFKELILSIELEFMFSKDEILTMYLNEIPYGNSNAGVEAAAKMYYGKPAKDLDLSQAATLVAIPQSPTYLSPYGTHTAQLVARRNYVLDRMVDTGKISKADADKAKLEDTTTLNVSLKPRRDSMLAPHFAMYTLEQVADQYGDEKIQKQGLKIITTLDYDKQKIAEQSIEENKKNVNRNNGQNAALVSIDPKTGQILAMVGSMDYFDTSIDGNVNVANSLRQPGSSFKVFEYSTLLKQKEYSPSKIFYDFQTDFGGGYVPRNYNGRFNGPITMRYALQNSLNIPAIKATALAGLDNVIKTASDMGITTLTDRARYGVSLGIGVAEVRPVEMASAYGTLANGGNHQDLTPILKVTDSNGKILYDFDKDHNSTQALDPQIAYEMSNMLSDNATRTPTFGARSALYFADHTVAAKTGTTQNNRDGWTCGYTPSIATAVWTGNNMPSPMKRDAVEIAGPIFHEYMTKVLAGTPNEDFKVPSGIQKITVEKYSNKLPGELSTETTNDIFADWQVPTDKDNVHVKVRVCKANGKLAPDGMSDSLTEERTFTNLHSEKPNDPNWENPVRAWAEANGMTNSPPTEYCNANDVTPTLSITSPANNATVSGTATITASSSTNPVNTVEFFIDDISIGQSDTGSPNFSKSYNFDSLSVGTHRITAVGTDASGGTIKSTIIVSVYKSTPPETLAISEVESIPAKTTATISWMTNLLSTSQVEFSLDHTYNLKSSADTALTTTHSVTLSGLIPDTIYYYKVISTDSSGTKTSEEKTFTTLSS